MTLRPILIWAVNSPSMFCSCHLVFVGFFFFFNKYVWTPLLFPAVHVPLAPSPVGREREREKEARLMTDTIMAGEVMHAFWSHSLRANEKNAAFFNMKAGGENLRLPVSELPNTQ